jgi:hypothetical protein
MKNVKMYNKTWWCILDTIRRTLIFDAKVDFRDFWGPGMVRGVWVRIRWGFLKYVWTNKFRSLMGFDRFFAKIRKFSRIFVDFCRFLMFLTIFRIGFWTCEICVEQYAYLNSIKADKHLEISKSLNFLKIRKITKFWYKFLS